MTVFGYVVLSLGALGVWALAVAVSEVRDKLGGLLELELFREERHEELRQSIGDHGPEA